MRTEVPLRCRAALTGGGRAVESRGSTTGTYGGASLRAQALVSRCGGVARVVLNTGGAILTYPQRPLRRDATLACYRYCRRCGCSVWRTGDTETL